jgi:hypothetical protein
MSVSNSGDERVSDTCVTLEQRLDGKLSMLEPACEC